MKKIFLALFALIALSACENNDGPSGPTLVESHLFIDGRRFEPSPASGSTSFVTTTMQTGTLNGSANQRTFNLVRTASESGSLQSLSVVIIYPAAITSITGTYEFNAADFDPTREAQALFRDGDVEYAINEGTITVDDNGSGQYRLSFSNTKLVMFSNQSIKLPVTGYIESVFTQQ